MVRVSGDMRDRTGLRRVERRAMLGAGVRDFMSSGAFFVPSRDRRPASSNPRRENGMACSIAPASSDAQLKNGPDAAGGSWPGLLKAPSRPRQRAGTPADAWASPYPRPILTVIPLLDNRRFV